MSIEYEQRCGVVQAAEVHPTSSWMQRVGRALSFGGTVVLLLLVVLQLGTTTAASSKTNGGWSTAADALVAADGPCNIDTHDAGSLTQAEFLKRYAYNEPLIITDFDNSEFAERCTRDRMEQDWGAVEIQLSSANTYSYSKRSATVTEYLNEYLSPQRSDRKGNETYYLFGDIDRSVWDPLLRHYQRPPWTLPGHSSMLSFGIAGAGTGVPFHIHGPVYAEVIFGQKRWFLYPYEEQPHFDPNTTTLEWFRRDYPNLPFDKRPLECVLKPGQVLYLPDRWWHATLNVETSVFMSTFLSP